MDFDSRPGLKFLLQHICQTNISANLYQLSALAWCVQFVVDFALCNTVQHRNEECLASLCELFREIEAIYGEKVGKKVELKSGSKASKGHHHQQRLSTSEEALKSFDILFVPVESSCSTSKKEITQNEDTNESPEKIEKQRRHSKANPFDEGNRKCKI